MPGGGDECIRNSLVCKTVSVNSKYHGLLPAMQHLLSQPCSALPKERTRRKGCSKGQWTLLRPQWPLPSGSGTKHGLRSRWKWILRSCPGIPEDAWPCHMKTTPDDPAQLPGATEEIVFAEGVGLANLSYWANKGSPARSSPSSRLEQLQCAGEALLLIEEMNL